MMAMMMQLTRIARLPVIRELVIMEGFRMQSLSVPNMVSQASQ